MTKFSSTEKILLALAIGLGAFIRLAHLGALPLGDDEARWALQALDVARGLRVAMGPAPAYVSLTGLLFFLFTPTDALARLIPSLAGTLLVATPLLFRRYFSPLALIFFTFGLAIDPALAALSRTAGSSILSISFTLWAVGLWLNDKPRAAGLFAGLALLSGPALWGGLLVLFVAGLIWRGLAVVGDVSCPRFAPEALRGGAISALVVFAAVGSLLLAAPHGLAAAFTAPVSFLQGWFTPSGVAFQRLLLALLFYHLLPLAFALVALVRAMLKTDPLDNALGIWLGVALALALAAPGRQVTDLGWALLPLWALAARELARLLQDFALTGEVAGATALTLAMLGFAWLDLSSISPLLDAQAINLRLLLFFGVLVLLALSLRLVGLGWSFHIARLGGVSGILAALFVFTLAAAWGATGLRAQRTPEMWQPQPAIDQSALLVQTINDLGEWSRGVPTSLQISVLGVDSPALAWALRHHRVTFSTVYTPSLTADPLIISYNDSNLPFAQSYRGQDFFWRTAFAWDTATFTEWIDWLARRKIPFVQDTLILWARADIFPGAAPAQP